MITSNLFLGSIEAKCPEKDAYQEGECDHGLQSCQAPSVYKMCRMSCCVESETVGTRIE